jgi:hypothetical protein
MTGSLELIPDFIKDVAAAGHGELVGQSHSQHFRMGGGSS